LYANDASHTFLSEWQLAVGQAAPPVLQALVAEASADGVSRNIELEHNEHVISFFAVPVREEGYANVYGMDITQRQQAESALRQSEERFSKSFFNTPVALVLSRLSNGSIFEVNDHFLELFEFDRADVLGRTSIELNMFPDPGDRAVLIARLQTQSFIRDHEMTVRVHSGALREVLLSAVIVTLNNEECLLTTLIDITERKQMERDLHDLNATLEDRVQARTAELQIATNRLRERDRMKDNFVDRINHELRTPLANIKLFADLLEHGKPERHAHYFQMHRREADRLQVLIEDLLKIRQLTSKAIELEISAVDLNGLIDEHRAAWGALSDRRGLAFKVDLAHDLPPVLIDAQLILQVIAQLLHNAVNYTARGTITLLTARRQRDQRVWVTLSVADTGPGIAPDELPHIFEHFYRGRAAADYKTPGTGVGLSISRDIVALLDGQITVESEIEQGSTFTVWLPVISAA
jgi:PAS domain S-box-containing protein